jgi:hypothetical protein
MRHNYNTIRFTQIPTQEVRDALKSNGFWWDRRDGCWKAERSVRSATVCDYIQEKWDCNMNGLGEAIGVSSMLDDCGII